MLLKLSWRNIWRNKRRTAITVSAIMFAVIVAVLMQSLNRGSHEIMIDNMVRFHTGYVQIQDYRFKEEASLDNSFLYDESTARQIMETHDEIEVQLPRIETFMLAGNETTTRGTLVFGIDPEKEHAFNGLKNHIIEGDFFDWDDTKVVISSGLARRLQLNTGDQILLLGQGRFGMSANGLYEISGIIRHPLRDLNNQAVFMPLPEAQFLLSAEEHVTAVLVGIKSGKSASNVARALTKELESQELRAYTWQEKIPELLQLLQFDLAGAYLMAGILYIVIAFGFFGTILTMTMERLHEFGTLISVGMKRSKLALVVFFETLFISIIGVIIGIILAWLLVYYLHLNPIELTGDVALMVIEMGWEPIIPMSFASSQFYMQGIIVFGIATLVFLFPLIKIFNLNIMEASRK